MARGGKRTGVQGRSYGNRSDLAMNARPLPVSTPTGKPYGEAGAMADAQRAVPLAPPPAPGAAGGSQTPPGPVPGSFGPFDRETENPNEPLTAGANIGPGPGMEALGGARNPTDITQSLLSMAVASGSRDLYELYERSVALRGR